MAALRLAVWGACRPWAAARSPSQAREGEYRVKIAIVTDSTCDWHFEDYAARGVTMVPLKVNFGGEESYTDQYEISCDEFYDKMIASETLPTSSQPSPHDFAQAFERLASEGYEGIVSMHIAPTLSGTIQAAEIAAQTSPIPVRTFDSRGAASLLGLLVDKACELRETDITLDEMCDKLNAYRDACRIVLAPETLENLVKGGRMPAEAASQAGMLNIRLIITLTEENGLVNVLDKVKGQKGQISAMTDYLTSYVEEHGPARVRLLQARNQKGIDKLVDALADAGVDYETVSVDNCGAIIATHLGMGTLGIAMAPRDL